MAYRLGLMPRGGRRYFRDRYGVLRFADSGKPVVSGMRSFRRW